DDVASGPDAGAEERHFYTGIIDVAGDRGDRREHRLFVEGTAAWNGAGCVTEATTVLQRREGADLHHLDRRRPERPGDRRRPERPGDRAHRRTSKRTRSPGAKSEGGVRDGSKGVRPTARPIKCQPPGEGRG